MRITTITFAAVFSLAHPVAVDAASPENLAHDFYAWLLSVPGTGSGLPAAKEREHLAELLSPTLLQLLDSATVMEKRCIQNNTPGDKPYIIEGNILVGNYEGATEIVVGKARNEGKTAIVKSRLFSVDSRFPKSHPYRVHTWTDELVMNQYRDRWVIANIQFETGNSLSKTLDEYLRNGAKWCKTPTKSKLESPGSE